MSGAPPLLPLLYDDVVRRALLEDLGRAGDVTTDALIAPDLPARARSWRGQPAGWPACLRRSTPSGCSIPSAGSRSSATTARTWSAAT